MQFLTTNLSNIVQKCQYKHYFQVVLLSVRIFSDTHKIKSVEMSQNQNNTSDNIFMGVSDRYDGVTVRSDKESCDSKDFIKKLTESLRFWRESKKRGIWFKVFLDQSDWVPILAKNGFKYHHAKDDFAMMYLWLPEEQINIPPYAHTTIGVGAVVVNDKNQVLVVREKYFNTPHWKLPGGYVEKGENLVDAAIREVKEETNISTTFHSVLTLRHAHHGMFGCSDIYTVVSLRPLPDSDTEDGAQTIKKCEREIEDCQWLNIAEYLKHPGVHSLNRMFVQKYLEHIENKIVIDCDHGIHQIVKVPYTVYSVKKDL